MKAIQLIIFAFLSISGVAQYTIEGSIWNNGKTAICNWYLSSGKIAMELKFEGQEGVETRSVMIMNSENNELTIVTETAGSVTYYKVNADSINGMGPAKLDFIDAGEFTQVAGQHTHKYQASSHEINWMLIMGDQIDFDLSPFKTFLKNDAAFMWVTERGMKGFPLQSVSTGPMGDLKSSWKASTLKTSLVESIFLIPSGALELKF